MLIVPLGKSELRRKQFQEINLIIILLSHHSIGIVVFPSNYFASTKIGRK